MMYAKIPYKDKVLNINIWNIGDEKEFLLNYGNIENEEFSIIVKQLAKTLLSKHNKDIEKFIDKSHYIDILFILFKCSLYVNSSSIKEYKVKCNKCSNTFIANIDISEDKNIYFKPFYENTIVIDNIPIKIISKDLKKIDEKILDKISIKSYKFLKNYLKNIDWDFYIKGECFCTKCGEKNTFVNNYMDIFLNIIIESDLKYYYETLFFLKKTMGMTMEEFDKMKNFEVEILVTKMNDLLKNEEGQ